MDKAFILGNPRSGTSLLRIMLNSHPDIVAPPECGFLQWWYSKYKSWNENSIEKKEFDCFLIDLMSSRKFETWNIQKKELKEYLKKKHPKSYLQLTECIYRFWGEKHGKVPKLIIDKNNYYIHHLALIYEAWPDSKFILLVRDGRDVACSYKEVNKLDTDSPYKPDLPNKIDIIAKEWVENNDKVIKFFKSIPSSKSHIIRYEDVILKTEESLKNLTTFLELNYDSAMLSYYKKNQKHEIEPAKTLDWKRKTLNEPDISNISKYINKLSTEEIKYFELIASDYLEIFGYE